MKQFILLVLIFSSLSVLGQHSNKSKNDAKHWITTIDFVEILNGHKEETLYYYEHNWKVLRKMALAKDYIENYQLLITPVSEDNKIGIILMTTYTNQSQYEKREPHFEELIKEKGALNLMNDLKPNEFRKIVFSKENVIHHD